jgi:hypothetical protein
MSDTHPQWATGLSSWGGIARNSTLRPYRLDHRINSGDVPAKTRHSDSPGKGQFTTPQKRSTFRNLCSAYVPTYAIMLSKKETFAETFTETHVIFIFRSCVFGLPSRISGDYLTDEMKLWGAFEQIFLDSCTSETLVEDYWILVPHEARAYSTMYVIAVHVPPTSPWYVAA